MNSSFAIKYFRHLFLVSVFAGTNLFSAPLSFSHYKNPRRDSAFLFERVYLQTQYFFYKNDAGILDVRFPYVITNGNSSTTQIFSSTKTNITAGKGFSYTLPGLEVGYGRFSIDANYNIITGPVIGWTDNFYFGLNYRLPSPLVFLPKRQLRFASISFIHQQPNPWQLLFHLGLEYYHPLYKLGEVTIHHGEYFSAAGYKLPYNDKDTAQNGDLEIYFQQNVLALTPSLELAYQSTNNKFFIGLRVAPMIMISQKGGLRFDYTAASYAPSGFNIKYINLTAEGVEAKYNGQAITSTPFHLQGYMISLRMGLHFE